MYKPLRDLVSRRFDHRPRLASRPPLRAPVALLLALTMFPFLPFPALAHGTLQRATPGDGDQLSAVPRELRLTFTEDVEVDLTRLALTGPGGRVALAPLELAPDSATVVVAGIEGSLVAGTYSVEWQVVGNDGHPVRGEYSFSIAPDAEGLAMADTSAPGTTPEATPTPPTVQSAGDTGGSGSDALVWIIGMIGLGAVGLVAFRLLSRPGANEEHV